ncbi:MAG: hypothetical protein ACJ79X_02300 [Gemmatimonadaceae bacterium]|jgi:hypothetical protein
MQRAKIFTALAGSLLTLACATTPPGTEISSSDFDVQPLVGVWRGSFGSAQTGRSGTVALTLRAGESSAKGNVVLLPRPDSLLTPEEREAPENVNMPGRLVVGITFIRKEGGSLRGTLDPYTAPDCNCIVATTFQGMFTDANTIEGSFTTVPSKAGASVSTGVWKVTRVKRL